MAHLTFNTHSANDPGGTLPRLCSAVAEENGHVFAAGCLKKIA